MSEWQPIETAPKMQTVLLFCPHEHYEKAICIGRFWIGDGNWKKTPHGKYLSPTHWMPIPEPPK